MEKTPKDNDKIDFIADHLSDHDFSFSEENLESFREIANSFTVDEQLGEPLSQDRFISFLEVYIQISPDAKRDSNVEKVISLMEGEAVEGSPELEEMVEAVLDVARVIAQNLDILEISSNMQGGFSLRRTEELREQINNYSGEPIFNKPLTEKEVWELVALYERTHPKKAKVPAQKAKLVAILQGRSLKDIAEEFNVEPHTISSMWQKALSNIAREFQSTLTLPEVPSILPPEQQELPKEVPEQIIVEHALGIIIRETGLSRYHSTLLKKQMLASQPSIVGDEVLVNIEVCDMIRKEIEQRISYLESLEETSAMPTSANLQYVHILLGNKKNGVVPTSRTSLLRKYEIELEKMYGKSREHEEIIENRIALYNSRADAAIIEVALWMNSSLNPNM